MLKQAIRKWLVELQIILGIKAYEIKMKSCLYLRDWKIKIEAALYHLTPNYKCTDPDCPGYVKNTYWDGMDKVRNSRAVSAMLRRKY